MDRKPPALSDFGFEVVVAHFKLTKEQRHEHAAMRTVFRDCIEFIPTFSDAENARIRAADIAIKKIEPRYRLFIAHADDFFKNLEKYNKSALAWAVVANDLVSDACENSENSEDSTNLQTLRKGQRIWEDACAILADEDLPNYTFAPESFFLAHVDAIEDLTDLELHLDGWSLGELIDKKNDGFSVFKKFLRQDTSLGQVLAAQISIVEDRIAAFIDTQPQEPAPKPIPPCEVIAFPGPKR